MAAGAGKYDDVCSDVRERTHARAAMVVVLGGNKGNGFSVQAAIEDTVRLHLILREVADQIEADLKEMAS